MKTTSLYRIFTSSVAVAAAVLTLSGLPASAAAADDELDWKAMTISPVANPIYFESPIIQSEVRPIFMYHNISDDFIGGFARVYAVQLRYAVTERLAVIASKDGFIQLRPNVPGLKEDGWANIAAGVKYAVIDDKENAFILTPGLVFEIPIGSEDVFQGNGDGAFNLFVSTMKGWDKFHVTANLGTTIPINLDDETASLRYSLQLDYYTCRWFIPFVVANGQTVLNDANGPAYGVEGFDLINFGTSNAKGFTEIALGAGFRSRPFKIMDVGFAYEKAVTHPEGIFDDRFTVDMIIRF